MMCVLARLMTRMLGEERGQAVVEYAIVFPIQLLLTLSIIQLAHIFIAKQVIEYGAFCGARAKLVDLSDDDVMRAVIIPISGIAGTTGSSTADFIELPGWGRRLMTEEIYRKLRDAIPNGERWDEERAALDAEYRSQGNSQYYGHSGAARDKTQIVAVKDSEDGRPIVRCEVTHLYELTVPIGNTVAYALGSVLPSAEDLDKDTYGVPHLRMKATCLLAQPWGE